MIHFLICKHAKGWKRKYIEVSGQCPWPRNVRTVALEATRPHVVSSHTESIYCIFYIYNFLHHRRIKGLVNEPWVDALGGARSPPLAALGGLALEHVTSGCSGVRRQRP